jgi:polar amino acid transport system permease protein
MAGGGQATGFDALKLRASATFLNLRILPLLIVGVIGVQTAITVIANPHMQWSVVGVYIFSPVILGGVLATILITIGAWFLGISGGLALAVMRSSENRLASSGAIAYVSVVRSIPLLVQILFWYNLATFIPQIFVGIPFSSLGVAFSTNDLLPPIAACLVALGLNQAAYMSEIIRSGLLGVPAGQKEAAKALGMTRSKIFKRVVAPQAFRIIIPSLGNDFVSLMKATSLVSVVGVGDLMTRAQSIYAVNYQVIPLLMVASLWYFALTTAVTSLQTLLETRLSRGFSTSDDRVPAQAALVND